MVYAFIFTHTSCRPAYSTYIHFERTFVRASYMYIDIYVSTYVHLILIIYLRMLHFIGTSLLFLQLLIAPKMIACLVSSIIVGLLVGKGLCIHTNIHTYYLLHIHTHTFAVCMLYYYHAYMQRPRISSMGCLKC